MTSLGLHVHYGDQAPFWTATVALVPRGITPEVGRHVAVRRSISDDHASYVIDWDAAPDYGSRPAALTSGDGVSRPPA